MQFQKLKKYKRVMEVPRFFLFTSNLTLPQHLKVSSFHGLTQGGTHAKKVAVFASHGSCIESALTTDNCVFTKGTTTLCLMISSRISRSIL